jgi:hypothetical protein
MKLGISPWFYLIERTKIIMIYDFIIPKNLPGAIK